MEAQQEKLFVYAVCPELHALALEGSSRRELNMTCYATSRPHPDRGVLHFKRVLADIAKI